MWTLHYEGPDFSGKRKGEQVGGPYKDKNRARAARDRKDDEHGGYVHRLRPIEQGSSANATANLMKEERLSSKQHQTENLAKAAEKVENKLPMTAYSLSKLGAGSEYGS